MIDPRAKVAPGARIAAGASVGAFSIIEEDVEIGEQTWIGPHVVIRNGARIGCANRIFQFSSIGEEPQHVAYRGQPTHLQIGDGNIIREYCAIHRGTVEGGGVTRIGNNNFLMTHVHVAHDCVIGDNVVLVNGAGLSGHVEVGDNAIMSGFVLVHQFCRIGTCSMTGPGVICLKDVPPYMMVAGCGSPALHGINKRGLRRRDFSAAAISALVRAYRTIFRSGLDLAGAVKELHEAQQHHPEVRHLLECLQSSKRGYLR